MKVEAIALSDFVHGDITAVEGRLLKHRDGSLIDSGLAGDLERAGLCRIRLASVVDRPPVLRGKTVAAGAVQPSSSSPAAPASSHQTSNTLRLGGGKSRKGE